jgi:hypothetical protein
MSCYDVTMDCTLMPMSGRRWTVEGMCHAWRRFGELTPAVAVDGAHE